MEAALVDRVMEAALVYLEAAEAPGLTLLGLTHSAWWESSLMLEMGWSQNSHGIITASSPSGPTTSPGFSKLGTSGRNQWRKSLNKHEPSKSVVQMSEATLLKG